MLQLVLGPVHSGKSRYLQSVIAALLKQEKEIYYIVPEQLSYETEKSFLETFGIADANHIRIMTFTKLCDLITTKTGGLQAPELDEGLKSVCMMLALQNLSGQLGYYKRSAGSLAFAQSMCKVVDELKQSGVMPAALQEVIPFLGASNLPDKLRDIGLLYETYNAIIQNRFIDLNDRLAFCAAQLGKQPVFEDKILFFDAFDGFMPNQHALLEGILAQAKGVYISLPCDGQLYLENDLSVFANVRAEARRLLAAAAKQGIAAAEPVVLAETDYRYPELQQLEQVLSEQREAVYEVPAEQICLVQSSHVYDMLDFIAFEIKRLIARQGYRYRDFAIVARSCAPYIGAIESIAAKYTMPVFFDQKYALVHTPLFRLLIAALSAAEKMNSESVFNMLKSGLLPFTAAEVAELENYCYIWDIDRLAWFAPWTKNPSGFEKTTEEMQGKLDRLNRLRMRLVDMLAALRGDMGDTVTQITKALYRFITANGVPEALRALCAEMKAENALDKAQNQSTAYDKMMEVFNKLIACDDGHALSVSAYMDLFFACANGVSVGTVPHRLDTVMFCSSDRARVTGAKVVFMLGVNQGEQPRLGAAGGLLSDYDRQEMIAAGIQIRDDLISGAIDEKFKFYASACAASERVYFCYSLSDFAMQTLEPAYIIAELESLFPACRRLQYSAMQNTDFADMYDIKPAFEKTVLHRASSDPAVETADRFFHNMPAFAERLSMLQDVGKGAFALSGDTARALYGKHLQLSATQIETFHKCPFAYFCRYGIGAKPIKRADIDAMHRGTLVHYYLEKFIGRHMKDYARLSEAQIIREIDVIAENYLEEFGLGADDLGEQLRYIFADLKEQIFLMIRDIVEELKNSAFAPVACELQIGKHSEIPALRVAFSGGVLSVSGIVDRVDTAQIGDQPYVRIVDYKTNSKKFRLNDLLYGLNMQMLLYLYAIVQNTPYKIAGILYKPAKRALAETTDLQPDTAPAMQSSGLLLREAAVITAMDATGRYIAAEIKGETVGARGTATAEEFTQIFRAMETTLAQMGEALHRGVAAARPLHTADKLPCAYCDYKAVCLTEGEKNTRPMEKRKDAEALAVLEERGSRHGL